MGASRKASPDAFPGSSASGKYESSVVSKDKVISRLSFSPHFTRHSTDYGGAADEATRESK